MLVSLMLPCLVVSSNKTTHFDDDSSIVDRFAEGSLSHWDMILLVAVGVLSMEIINFLSENLGGKPTFRSGSLKEFLWVAH